MKRGGNVGIGLLAGVLLSASAVALTSVGAENPYSAIVERNVFNLHPPPPPLNPADLVKKTPPPKIMLTGITTTLGKKVTYLTLPPTKPGAQPESVMLAEGQAQDEIEVKSIDEKAGVVQLINHGEPQTLDFDHDSPKPAGMPAGGSSTPIALPAPIPAQPREGVQPGAGTLVRPLRGLPARNSSAENNGGQGSGGGPGFGGGVGSGNFNQQAANPPMTAEEQAAIIELQRIKALKDNDPISKVLPPTELTSEVMGGQPGMPAAQ